jgi:hypothetical protein
VGDPPRDQEREIKEQIKRGLSVSAIESGVTLDVACPHRPEVDDPAAEARRLVAEANA